MCAQQKLGVRFPYQQSPLLPNCRTVRQLSKKQADGSRCNVWVYCPSPTGECWSPDICEPAAAGLPSCQHVEMQGWGWPLVAYRPGQP